VGGVFINYRGEDSHSYAAMLHMELSRRVGTGLVFLDSASIPAGADFSVHLLNRVRRASVLLAVVGSGWLTATNPSGGRRIDDPEDWVRRELVEAFAAGVTVIPVLTDEGTLPTEAELPDDIAAFSRCQYRRLRHRDAPVDLARIFRDLAALDPDLAAATRRPSDPPQHLHARVRLVGLGTASGFLAVALIIAAMIIAVVILAVVTNRPSNNPPAAGVAPSSDRSYWHTGGHCPETGAMCFYNNRNFNDLLGWFTPPSCSGTYPMLWPFAVESIRNRTGCGVYLLSCPGDCWKEWMRPSSEDGTIDPLNAVDRIRLGG